MPVIPPLERNHQTPLYEQIYRYLRGQIENGTLKAGEALPSRREMASLCNVSTTTVWNAYEQLISEGYIATRPKSGTFVEGGEPQALFPRQDAAAASPVSDTGNKAPPIRYDCRFGRIDESAFPYKAWRSFQQNANQTPGAMQRGDPQGERPLREALCGYLRKLRGVDADPSRVVIGAGLEWLLLALLPFFPATARFGMEDPGYTPYRKLLRAYGREVVSIPSKAEPDVLYLQPSHRFPLGGVLSVRKRHELLQWASETGGTILEDDYDSELRYRGLPIPSLQSMDRAGRVVYLGSFSGSFSPALRIGYMVLPAELAERRQPGGHVSCAVSVPDQLALAGFIQEGKLERHVVRMRTLYRRRRERLLELLKPLEPGIMAEDDGAGLFVRLAVNMREGEALRLAAEAGVRLTGVSQFYEEDHGKEKARVLFGFGGLQEADLREAAGILERVWSPRGRSI